MVDQSDAAFRKLVRARGVELCYSPMLLAAQVATEPTYRQRYVDDDLVDDACVVQLGGSDVNDMVAAARYVLEAAPRTLAIDVNLECPQSCARRGGFGAFLAPDKAFEVVRALVHFCRVGCKIRAQVTPAATAQLASRLVSAGASFIAVHGRTRDQRGRGDASWAAVRAVVEAVAVPVIGNGNVRCKAEAAWMLRDTGAAAIMSAEPLLANPSLFLGVIESRRAAAKAYLNHARRYRTPLPWVEAHLAALYHDAELPSGDFDALEAAVLHLDDEPCSPPTRRDLMTGAQLDAAARRRARRHSYKAGLARASRPPTAAALAAAAQGRLVLCARCGRLPAKRSCPHASCRACCARGRGTDCGNHPVAKKRKQCS